MFQNMQIIDQPVFYLFLAVSILLSLGYIWGKRRNTRIHLSAFNAVVDCVKPKDQNFTNIGGLTGYHANLIPKKNKVVGRVDLTLTMLPRQSWLYLPFSWISMRFDRLFVTLLFAKKVKPSFQEGHLIEKEFGKRNIGKIDNPEDFRLESLQWGGVEYELYTKDDVLSKGFKELIHNVPDPVIVKHIALVPKDDKAYFFVIPVSGKVSLVFGDIYNWILKMIENG
ncbi:MAG TPA: hypothetical protein DCO79_15545 [Spirochaeta sp.]|nr:hypothetical protein [Spirochaeta sp.]